MMGLTRCYKTEEGFYIYVCTVLYTAGLLSDGVQNRLLQSVPSYAGFVLAGVQVRTGKAERPGLAQLRQSS